MEIPPKNSTHTFVSSSTKKNTLDIPFSTHKNTPAMEILPELLSETTPDIHQRVTSLHDNITDIKDDINHLSDRVASVETVSTAATTTIITPPQLPTNNQSFASLSITDFM